jgi:hypothetical protein
MPSLTPLSLIPSSAACALRREQGLCVPMQYPQAEHCDTASGPAPFSRADRDQRLPDTGETARCISENTPQVHLNQKHFP